MKELTKFHDKDQNVWDIKKEDGKIIMVKNEVNTVFFLDNELGNRLLKRKIKKLKGE